MLIYLLLTLAIFYALFFSRVIIIRNIDQGNNEIFIFRNHPALFIAFVILLELAALKGVGVGVDYPMYYGFFLNKSYSEIEPGIRFFYDLAIKYDNFFVFSIGIYSLFLFFIFMGIRKHSPNYLISVLFFLLTYIYLNSYNQLRQMLAVSIIFCFVNDLLTNKKTDKIKYFFIILIALLFHNSAIFLFLLFFIPKKRFSPKVVIPLFLVTILLYFIPSFKNQVGVVISSISGLYAEKYATGGYNFFGVNKEKGLLQLIPVMMQMVIVTIALYFPKEDPKLNINYKLYHFSANLVIISLWLYSLAGIEAIDRLQLYFSSFNLYFYPILIHLLLNGKKKRHGQLFILFITGFWILYYILRLDINVAGVVPYRFY